jgi:hypothetical protein
VGYLLYPINFFIWSWLMRSEEDTEVTLEAESVVTRAPESELASLAA